MTDIFICETHHPNGRAEAYQSTVGDLTRYACSRTTRDNSSFLQKRVGLPELDWTVWDMLAHDLQKLIVEYSLKSLFYRCKEHAETYGAFFKALDSHKFLDDPFKVEDNPFLNRYREENGKLVETGNEPVIQVTIFDDSRIVAVSELLENDPSSTAFADIALYDDFKTEIGEQIETILEDYIGERSNE